jgi:hypothetical protein
MITIHEIEQGSDEWQALREDLYTGSNAHKLLAHPNAMKIVDGKPRKYALAEITGFGGNFWTKRGHMLEDEAIELYQQIKSDHKVGRPGFVTNDAFPDCGYSPDGDDETMEATLEVKCFDEGPHMELIRGNINIKILAQIHFGLTLWERKLARLIAYCPRIEDPKLAFKIIDIKAKPSIKNNFKRILTPERATA